MKKKVSIALATYNGAKYLPELLESLNHQTVLPYELVVVDDGSIDDTIKILKDFASRNAYMKIFVNKKNLGVNKNFEKAISLCCGDYIFICDQDDVWLPTNIERKLSMLEQTPSNKPGFVACEAISVDENLNQLEKVSRKNDCNNPYEIFFYELQGANIAINRRLATLMNQWPSNFKDFPYDGYIRFCAFLTANMFFIREPLMYYRRHANNVIGAIENINSQNSFWERNIRLFPKRMEMLKKCLITLPKEQIHLERLDKISYMSELLCNSKGVFGIIPCLFINFIPIRARIKICLIKFVKLLQRI